MTSLTIDLSGLGGLGERFYGDRPYASSKPNLRYLGKEDQVAEGIYNPIAELGYSRPANNTTKAATGTTSFLLSSACIVPSRLFASSTNGILFSDEAEDGTAGQILSIDSATDTSLANVATMDVQGGTDEYNVVDMVLYQKNGVRNIYYATRNNTGNLNSGNIGVATLDWGTQDDDWGSAVQSLSTFKADRLVFVLADNGFLYILDSNAVHRIDGTSNGGTNGTVGEAVLVFMGARGASNDAGTALKDGIDLRGRMWIGLHVMGASSGLNAVSPSFDQNVPSFIGVYIWDRRTTVASMQDFIPITGAKEFKCLFVLRGTPGCFTISTDGYTQLRLWNGSEFAVVRELGKSAYPPFRRHSYYVNGDMIYWIGNDGYIYCYGKPSPGRDDALYIIGDMTQHVTGGQTFTSSGVLVPANNTETVTSGVNTNQLAFYVSFKDSGGNHLKKWYPFGVETIASNTQTGHTGNMYSLVQLLPRLSTLRGIDIYCQPNGSSGDTTTVATLKFYANQSTTPFSTKTVTRGDISKGYLTYEFNKSYVNAFQMEVEWDTSQTLGTNDFCPSMAVLEYEPPTPKGGRKDSE